MCECEFRTSHGFMSVQTGMIGFIFRCASHFSPADRFKRWPALSAGLRLFS